MKRFFTPSGHKVTTLPSRAAFWGRHCFGWLVVAMLVLTAGIPQAMARDLVSGNYLSSSGRDIELRLVIASPAPTNLIVEQLVPPGNIIASTSPPARKIDRAQGNIKWLFRNTTSGAISLSFRLEEPLAGGVAAIVRYRSPLDGTFREMRITP